MYKAEENKTTSCVNTVSETIFEHFKIEVPDLRLHADLLTFTKEILKENITFNPVPVSARLLCVSIYALK